MRKRLGCCSVVEHAAGPGFLISGKIIIIIIIIIINSERKIMTNCKGF
jgi:hypothetical protein